VQRLLLRPAAGEHEVQARIVVAGDEEGLRQEVDALLLAQASHVEDVEADAKLRVGAGEHPRGVAGGVEALEIDAAVPAGESVGRDSSFMVTDSPANSGD
jgi:hypothetical protein